MKKLILILILLNFMLLKGEKYKVISSIEITEETPSELELKKVMDLAVRDAVNQASIFVESEYILENDDVKKDIIKLRSSANAKILEKSIQISKNTLTLEAIFDVIVDENNSEIIIEKERRIETLEKKIKFNEYGYFVESDDFYEECESKYLMLKLEIVKGHNKKAKKEIKGDRKYLDIMKKKMIETEKRIELNNFLLYLEILTNQN